MSELSDRDKQAIREVMIAVLASPDLDPEEYETRLGVSLERLKLILRSWPPKQYTSGDDIDVAVNNCLVLVCYSYLFEYDPGYTGLPPEDWSKWFSMSREELTELGERWNA